jgi:hypothetical protein
MNEYFVGSEVFTAVVMKSIIFWDVTPTCSSETSVASQQTTRCHIPEDDTLQGVFSFRLSDVMLLLIWLIGLVTIICCNFYQAIYNSSDVSEKNKIILFIYALFPVTTLVTIVKTNVVNIDNIPKFLTVDQFIDRRDRIYLCNRIRSGILKTRAI